MPDPVLTVRDLRVGFTTRRGTLTAVDGVSFDIAPGEVLGVVGESGAGKSLTGAAVIGLIEPPGRITSGEVRLSGRRIDGLPAEEMRKMRGRRIGMVFQDPLTSLNPLYRIGDQIVETIRAHADISESEARERAIALLQEAGIQGARARIDSYPHEFSGGMRQRVVLALALCAEPDLLIADEPTTALDVSIQAQIIALLKRLCRERGTAVMLITHDMGVIAETADRVAVMYAGRIVEIGPVREVIKNPRHPYTKGLMGAIPDRDGTDRPAGANPGDHAPPCLHPLWMRVSSPVRPGLRSLPEREARTHAGRCRGSRLLAVRRTRRGACMTGAPLVEVRDVSRVFDVSRPWLNRVIEGEERTFLKAVSGVSFSIGRQETLALVGESGSGKSTVARMIVGLLAPTAGSVTIDRIDMWATARHRERQMLRRRLQMIFQDPFASLNPRWRVKRIVADPIKAFGLAKDNQEIEYRVGELLRAGRARSRRRRQVSARVLRRPAPAHLHRASAVVESGVHRLRRADVGARRFGAGANPEPDARPAGPVSTVLSLHQPQSGGRAAHGGARGRDVSGPHRRDSADGRPVRASHAIPTRAC